MTKDEIAEMYVDWMIGADETIKMSDWLRACFEANIEPEEIYQLGDKLLKTRII